MGKFHGNDDGSLTTDLEKFDPSKDYRSYEIREFTHTPPEFQLVPIINKTLVRCVMEGARPFKPPARSSGKRKTFVVHPSQAAGCRRKVFFAVIDARKDRRPPDPEKERIFAMGHQAHERIQGYLFEAWNRNVGGVTRVWEDVKLKILELGVSGENDSIVEIIDYRYLVEIKTCSDSVYKNTAVPKIDWLWQVHIYMKALGLLAAILLLENRNNGRMRQFFIPFDHALWERIETDTLEVLVGVETEELPPMTDDKGDCYWCDYTEICKDRKMQQKIDYGRVHLPQVP